MKSLKLLLILFSVVFLSYCSDNVDERFENEPEKVGKQYFISDDFLINEKLSEDEIRFIAERFITTNSFTSASRRTRALINVEIENVFPLLSESGQNLAFIVNFKGGGYNIVSATKKYAPIIGFSETGSIDEHFKEENPAFAFWMDYLKADILCQMDKTDEYDTIAIKHRVLWREYEGAALAKSRSTRYITRDHRYWYDKERTNAMNRPFNSSSTLMSVDLQRFRDIVRTDYENRNNLTASEQENLRMIDTALKSEYARAGLTQPAASFWTEYHNATTVYDTGNLIQTFWQQGFPYNLFNPLKDVPPTSIYDDQRQPVGCVTVAVSQIINYHKYPNTLRRVLSPLATEGITVDWSKTNISNLYDSTKIEIPRFIRFVNKGVFTVNGDKESGEIGRAHV